MVTSATEDKHRGYEGERVEHYTSMLVMTILKLELEGKIMSKH